MLTPSGNVMRLPYREIKGICYVQEIDDLPEPARVSIVDRVSTDSDSDEFSDGDFMKELLPDSRLLGSLRVLGNATGITHQHSENLLPRQALTDISVQQVWQPVETEGPGKTGR